MTGNISWKIASIDEFGLSEFYKILKLRCDVFIVEQGRAVTEIDEKDLNPGMIHIAGTYDGKPIAYLRVSPPGLSYPEVSIERVVVSKAERKNGLGKKLMDQAIQVIKQKFPGKPVKIHAQKYLEKFYSSYGFHRVGDAFDEGGIDHIFLLSDADF